MRENTNVVTAHLVCEGALPGADLPLQPRQRPPLLRHSGQHMDDGLFLAPKPIGTVRFAQL